ncbi:membrane protein [Microbacterium phage Pumpernickel]|uniref:Membrane protein n=1 Tax=Microbacterium phage Pumpernickel TaxID=2885983 RepID=A0AAE8Y782_9CAUD|nr:membrane protein [Microbacterium phage Pumpernickel]UDL15935.1 membrane protein [Microbacterium phage Pumpernickel]
MKNALLGAATMLLTILLIRFGIPRAFMARMTYVDDVASGRRQKISLRPKKALVP